MVWLVVRLYGLLLYVLRGVGVDYVRMVYVYYASLLITAMLCYCPGAIGVIFLYGLHVNSPVCLLLHMHTVVVGMLPLHYVLWPVFLASVLLC
jgi:hypothetical protein